MTRVLALIDVVSDEDTIFVGRVFGSHKFMFTFYNNSSTVLR